MTLPMRHNIDVTVGKRIRRVFRWVVNGQNADLTDWTGRIRIGQNGQFVTEVSNAVTLGGTDGTATVDIPPGTLTDAGTYSYALDLLDPNDEPKDFVYGNLRILPEFP